MKLYTFDSATPVKTAITDMPRTKRFLTADKVYPKRPKYAIEHKDVAEAV
jgi:hypothetical protein